jgi:hypothetical protein
MDTIIKYLMVPFLSAFIVYIIFTQLKKHAILMYKIKCCWNGIKLFHGTPMCLLHIQVNLKWYMGFY